MFLFIHEKKNHFIDERKKKFNLLINLGFRIHSGILRILNINNKQKCFLITGVEG